MALLEVDALSVTFGGLAALSNVSLAVEAGSITAVIGPNGAGKTTLLNTISGYVRPGGGEVRLNGRRVSDLPAHAIARHGLRRTFQNGGIFGEMTVLENVLVGADRATGSPTGSSVLGMLLGLARDRRAERSAIAAAREMLAAAGLARLADTRARELSFGQQRLVEITRALIGRPHVLLLDEPAVGLAEAERDELASSLRRLAAERIAIVLVEHVIDLVMAVSDRVTVLNAGQVLAEGTPEQVRSEQSVLEAYLGSL
jgi:branched-chain amino acid transport system ATP-binding protein